MFSVIFEVRPSDGRKEEYLELAGHLKSIIATIDGFVDNERFESKSRPGWILSHSTWRDEKSVVRWRTEAEHHVAQGKGRFKLFRDYHLRVGDVTSDAHPTAKAPVHERRFDETEVGEAKMATFTEITPVDDAALGGHADRIAAHLGLDVTQAGVVAHDVWASIYNPGKLALLIGWTDAAAADAWMPRAAQGVASVRHRKVRVVRDYGRYDRRETPQYYPDVEDAESRRPDPLF